MIMTPTSLCYSDIDLMSHVLAFLFSLFVGQEYNNNDPPVSSRQAEVGRQRWAGSTTNMLEKKQSIGVAKKHI